MQYKKADLICFFIFKEIALHALVGGLMAEINDGKFGDGLTVGAVNEMLIGFLDANKEKLKLSDSSIKAISNKVGQMLGGILVVLLLKVLLLIIG